MSLVIGMVDGIVTIVWPGVTGRWPALLDGLAVLTGIWLLTAHPRAALWARSLAVFLLAAGIVLAIAAPLFQPLDLTLTEVRLEFASFAYSTASLIVLLSVTLWIAMRLGDASVRDAIISQWDQAVDRRGFPHRPAGAIRN